MSSKNLQDLREALSGDDVFLTTYLEQVGVEGLRSAFNSMAEEVQADLDFLCCLEACGVDNWVGYEDAQEMMND